MGEREGTAGASGRRSVLRAIASTGALGVAGCLSVDGTDPVEIGSDAERLIYDGFEEEGVEPPVETTIYANAENDERSRWAQLVQHELNETELFEIDFQQLEWTSYEQLCLNMADNEENCLITMDISGGWDPHSYVNFLFHSQHQAPDGFNFNHFADDRVDELIDDGRTESDQTRRIELYQDLQERLVQQLPISVIRFGEEVTVYRTESVERWRQYPLPGSEYEAVYAPYAGEYLELSKEDGSTELVGDAVATVSNSDPTRMLDTTSNMATTLIYEGLLTADFDGRPRPQLAADWEQLDATTYRFDLREGVTFHNGERFVADHVRASFERYEGTPRANDVYDWYDGVDVISDTELEIHLVGEYGPFESGVGVPIVPLAASEDGDLDLSVEPVGTGPYQFDEYADGEFWRIERYDGHWFDGDENVPATPPVETVTMRIITEAASRQAALEAGEIDVATGLPATSVTGLDAAEEYGVERSVAGAIDFLVYPLYLEPFGNPSVRRGIDRLLPRERILEEVYADSGTVGYTPVPSLLSEYTTPEFEAYIVDEYLE
ncbi:ABC transporter substrate-binding protein [Natrarchaeobius halalkaliphilus]|uniref:ABC transporter substrate-binding protein n=1 Tax=Natrarchaeobius halalkaliphilus TaxID=1679091 RepID=A0A3N6MBK6_9EURY|nr:ABC transporter substrate-binding protein [Natrarchaeobius halalkaliphilus]RQG92851.1 ABC transporter substrate-binding protein [Natrarchaeobius halalkaliphilus]